MTLTLHFAHVKMLKKSIFCSMYGELLKKYSSHRGGSFINVGENRVLRKDCFDVYTSLQQLHVIEN